MALQTEFIFRAFGIASENAVHIADIIAIHSDKHIVFTVIVPFKLNGTLADTFYPVLL